MINNDNYASYPTVLPLVPPPPPSPPCSYSSAYARARLQAFWRPLPQSPFIVVCALLAAITNTWANIVFICRICVDCVTYASLNIYVLRMTSTYGKRLLGFTVGASVDKRWGGLACNFDINICIHVFPLGETCYKPPLWLPKSLVSYAFIGCLPLSYRLQPLMAHWFCWLADHICWCWPIKMNGQTANIHACSRLKDDGY